eukprot:2628951-Rhodomonas_salina.1
MAGKWCECRSYSTATRSISTSSRYATLSACARAMSCPVLPQLTARQVLTYAKSDTDVAYRTPKTGTDVAYRTARAGTNVRCVATRVFRQYSFPRCAPPRWPTCPRAPPSRSAT